MNVDYVEEILEKGKENKSKVLIFMVDGKFVSLDFREDRHYSWIIYEDNHILIRKHTGSKVKEFMVDCDVIGYLEDSHEVKEE